LIDGTVPSLAGLFDCPGVNTPVSTDSAFEVPLKSKAVVSESGPESLVSKTLLVKFQKVCPLPPSFDNPGMSTTELFAGIVPTLKESPLAAKVTLVMLLPETFSIMNAGPSWIPSGAPPNVQAFVE
jgi:hypothetical protein